LNADLFLVLFTGLFLSFEPELYRRGALNLIPRSSRLRSTLAFDEIGIALTRWLKGVLITMLIVGFGTTLGLWLLGIPLALSLGALAGILEFVPYVGPVLSVIPSALVALTLGPHPMLEVLALYLLVHAVEAFSSRGPECVSQLTGL
jgi:predicted PurR-regulated permease PerM